MALNNCSINSTSVNVTKDVQLGGGVANQVLTITPDPGYVVAAANFSQNTNLSAAPWVNYITSITLANSGTPYDAANTVTVTVDLKDTYTPSADTPIVIDIDGDATDKENTPKTLSGVYNTTVTNATPASQSNVAYTATATPGSTATLFTKTFTANTNAKGSVMSGVDRVEYQFDNATSDADPGTDQIRINNAAFANVTKIWVDDMGGATSVNMESWYNHLSTRTTTPKGFVRLDSGTANYNEYSVTSIVDKTGYWELTVVHTGSGGSGASTSNGADIYLSFYYTSNYFFDEGVKCNLTTGDPDNYLISAVETKDSSDRILASAYTVKGIIPNATDTSDVLTFTASAIEIPPNTNFNEITSYTTNTAPMGHSRSRRVITAYGTPTATYKLTIVRSSDSQTYDFSTSDFTSSATDSGTLTISSSGNNGTLMSFPTVTANDTYTVTIAAVGNSILNLGATYTNPFTYTRVGLTNLTVSAASASSRSYTQNTITFTDYDGDAATVASGNPPLSGQPNVEITSEATQQFNFVMTLKDDVAITKSRDPVSTDFTLTNIGILNNANYLDLTHGTMTVSGSGTTTMTITGTGYEIKEFGTSNATMVLKLDDFIQAAGGGGGGSGSGLAATVSLQHDANGYSQIFYPPGTYTLTTSNTAAGSARTHVVNITGLIIPDSDLPNWVDNVGDISGVVTINDNLSTDAYDSSDVASGDVSISGSIVGSGANAYANISVLYTITGSGGGTVTNGDTLAYTLKFSFTNISQ